MNDIEKQYNALLEAANSATLNGDTLTDEALNDLIDVVDTIKDPAQNFPSNNGVIYNNNTDENINVKEDVLISAHPVTGVMNTIPYENDNITEQSLDELLNLKEEDLRKIEIGYDSFVESTKMMYPNATEEDIKILLNAVNTYRSGVKFSYFNSLPKFIKDEICEYVDNIIDGDQATINDIKQIKNTFAKELFDTFISHNYSSKAFADISKFTTEEINKEKEKLNLGNSVGDYNAKLREEYEINFIKKAEELENSEDEKDREKAKKFRDSSRMFTQAYTYEDMYDAYKNRKIKVKKIQIDKFKRTCEEFNRKYYNSTFSIRDIGLTIPILDRVLDNKYNIISIQKFIVAFINYTRLFSPSNIDQHIFMYYFIQNILSLDVKLPGSEEESFNDILKNNIHRFLDLIIEMDEDKERG